MRSTASCGGDTMAHLQIPPCHRFLPFRSPRAPSSYRITSYKSSTTTTLSSSDSSAPSTTSESKSGGDTWYFTETGLRSWTEAMELNTIAPELPQLLEEMGVKYEPERLADTLYQRPSDLASRAVVVAANLGSFITAALTDYASGQFESNAAVRATQLSRTLSRLGPSFIKVGQALSARPDLLPKEYLDALARLQDRLPSFPTSVAHAVIEEELGRPISDIYSKLSTEPVAAASLGQVYKGILRSTGEEVAVKVQRPGIGESIALDMVLLRRLMKFVDQRVSILSQPLTPLVDEFAARLFAELDYVQEGKSCEKFARLYAHVPRVRTPKIKWEATSRRVITMEWIDGVKLTDGPSMEAAGLDVVDFVTVGVECTLRQLLEAGFFHADPHPGNLLATRSGDLVYLDFGMMSEAPATARYAIIAHIVHLVNRDYLAMCTDYYALDFMDPSVDTTPIAPALASFFDDVLQNSSVSRLNFRTLVDGLGGVLFKYPFRVPAYYALILRSLTVLEGLALSADPNYNLLGAAYPYVARRLLTDPAPQLRSSFEDLVLKDGRLAWARLENLFKESSKSQDFDPAQLWLLAEWLCSESGRPVRKPLAGEVVRLVDASIAGAARGSLAQNISSPRDLENGKKNTSLAERLIPSTKEEAKMRRRARALWGMVASATSHRGVTDASGVEGMSTSGEDTDVGSTGMEINSNMNPLIDVVSSMANTSFTGMFGLPSPTDIVSMMNRARSALINAGNGLNDVDTARLRALVEKPGFQELVIDVQLGLAQRAAARSVKLFAAMTSGVVREDEAGVSSSV